MNLRELASYAEKKYHIFEQYLWKDFPGFSVLAHPDTGKWLALLMRGWDPDHGEMRECCDIKCGDIPQGLSSPFLTAPFRMKGRKWIGINMDDRADSSVVFLLFDQAYRAETPAKDVLVLSSGEAPAASRTYTDTPLPQNSAHTYADTPLTSHDTVHAYTDTPLPQNSAHAYTDTPLPQNDAPKQAQARTAIPESDNSQEHTSSYSPGSIQTSIYADVPEEILKMRRLYRYEGESFEAKYRNFYRQGKFMESYEDSCPWNGVFQHYFPTYHDLNIRQTRGYFTWRAKVRHGQYEPIAASMAYIYLYELLSGIGTSSPEESLEKMKEFAERFPGTIDGGTSLKRNLHRWMMEFCVLHNLPSAEARATCDPEMLKSDAALSVLRQPDLHSDAEVFDALLFMGKRKTFSSPILKNDEARGLHLFAAVWRQGVNAGSPDGSFGRRNTTSGTQDGSPGRQDTASGTQDGSSGRQNLFTNIFGTRKTFKWHPLANAVYYEKPNMKDAVYALDESRSYERRGGEWYETRYDSLFFDKNLLRSFLRSTDGTLRKLLKTGPYLKLKPDERWTEPYVRAALLEEQELERKRRIENISIDLESLGHIREDAAITRDALLAEEDRSSDVRPVTADPDSDLTLSTADDVLPAAADTEADNPDFAASGLGHAVRNSVFSAGASADPDISEEGFPAPGAQGNAPDMSGTAPDTPENAPVIPGLTPVHLSVLKSVFRGESPDADLKAAHLLPSIAVDTINEAFLDLIGDNVLECVDDQIVPVEDYREDVEDILSGSIVV